MSSVITICDSHGRSGHLFFEASGHLLSFFCSLIKIKQSPEKQEQIKSSETLGPSRGLTGTPGQSGPWWLTRALTRARTLREAKLVQTPGLKVTASSKQWVLPQVIGPPLQEVLCSPSKTPGLPRFVWKAWSWLEGKKGRKRHYKDGSQP